MSKYANKELRQNRLTDCFFALEPWYFRTEVIACIAWLKKNFTNQSTFLGTRSKLLIIPFLLLPFASCKKSSVAWNGTLPSSQQQPENTQVFNETSPSSQQQPGNARVFQEAKRIGEEEVPPFIFKFSTSGYSYIIDSDGQTKAVSDSGQSKDFRLKYPWRSKDSYLELLFYTEYESDLVLLYQVSNGESAGGGITRLDQRGLKAKWTTSIESFNIGKGMIDGDRVYITGVGLVACLSLKSGKYLWRHEQLYEQYQSFTAFDTPIVEGDFVVFTSRSDIGEPAKTIKVYKISGKVESVSDK